MTPASDEARAREDYQRVYDEFRSEFEKYATEIFLHPVPFTQTNRVAMIAATVATRALVDARRAALTEAAEIAREQARPHGTRWWQISEKIAAAIERARDGQE